MIAVVSKKRVDEALVKYPFEWVVSFGEVGSIMPHSLYGWDAAKLLRLEFDDVEYDLTHPQLGYYGITEDQAEELAQFLACVDGPVLFHCAAGISRSSGAALCYLALQEDVGNEAAAIGKLHEVWQWTVRAGLRDQWIDPDHDPNTFQPNRRLVYYVDGVVGMGGRLLAALEASRYFKDKQPFDPGRLG